MKPLMLTYGGKSVNPLDISVEDIDIEDIAHALANVNRFGGHVARPINVAQHSVYVSRLSGPDPVARLQGLLHDASEAYLGDVIKWLKATPEFAAYRRAEDELQRRIFVTFGLPEELLPEVDRADQLIVRLEGEHGFGREVWRQWSEHFPKYPVLNSEERKEIGPWAPWTWQQSQDVFMGEFRGQRVESKSGLLTARPRPHGAHANDTYPQKEAVCGHVPQGTIGIACGLHRGHHGAHRDTHTRWTS